MYILLIESGGMLPYITSFERKIDIYELLDLI